MTDDRRREFLHHVLPAWISAVCAICALALTAYTVVLVRTTSGNVADIMNHMGPR